MLELIDFYGLDDLSAVCDLQKRSGDGELLNEEHEKVVLMEKKGVGDGYLKVKSDPDSVEYFFFL